MSRPASPIPATTPRTATGDHIYLVLGINPAPDCSIVIAGIANSRTAANAAGEDRKANPEAPYATHRAFKLDDHTGERLRSWLDANGWTFEEIAQAIRAIGQFLLSCMPDFRLN